jgi:hypothetical protein
LRLATAPTSVATPATLAAVTGAVVRDWSLLLRLLRLASRQVGAGAIAHGDE